MKIVFTMILCDLALSGQVLIQYKNPMTGKSVVAKVYHHIFAKQPVEFEPPEGCVAEWLPGMVMVGERVTFNCATNKEDPDNGRLHLIFNGDIQMKRGNFFIKWHKKIITRWKKDGS